MKAYVTKFEPVSLLLERLAKPWCIDCSFQGKKRQEVCFTEMGEAVTIISFSIHWQANAKCIKIQESRTTSEEAKISTGFGGG